MNSTEEVSGTSDNVPYGTSDRTMGQYWDIPGFELQLGSSLMGFGDYSQSRVVELIADEIRENSQSQEIATEMSDLLMQSHYVGILSNTIRSTLQYPSDSIKILANEYIDYIGWPNLGTTESTTVDVCSEMVDGDDSCK